MEEVAYREVKASGGLKNVEYKEQTTCSSIRPKICLVLTISLMVAAVVVLVVILTRREAPGQSYERLLSCRNNMTASKTFSLKEGLETVPMQDRNYVDFADYLYSCNPVKKNQGRVLVLTDPTENGGQVISPGFSNGFVGAMYRAYNEHRHLVLRPDDVWLAITTAFGVFMNVKENAETMRKHFVDFEGKMKLEVIDIGSIYSVNWSKLIDRMSDLVEKNTKGDARTWIEPNFSTTTPTCKTVGQVVLMGVMKHYFDYNFRITCGLPNVTLEGTLDDWKKLQEKARHFASFGVEALSHWSGLLDVVLQKMVDSHSGNVDQDFWSHVVANEEWGSGVSYISGWINVFMPFTEKGLYILQDVKPERSEWGMVNRNDVPPSTVEIPVTIDDNGRIYKTIFYGGHIVCLYNPADNTIRPSLDWAMVDITGNTGPEEQEAPRRVQEYNPEALPKPAKFSCGDYIDI